MKVIKEIAARKAFLAAMELKGLRGLVWNLLFREHSVKALSDAVKTCTDVDEESALDQRYNGLLKLVGRGVIVPSTTGGNPIIGVVTEVGFTPDGVSYPMVKDYVLDGSHLVFSKPIPFTMLRFELLFRDLPRYMADHLMDLSQKNDPALWEIPHMPEGSYFTASELFTRLQTGGFFARIGFDPAYVVALKEHYSKIHRGMEHEQTHPSGLPQGSY